MSKWISAAALPFLIFSVCAGLNSSNQQSMPEFYRLTANGGRVDWYKGPATHDLIALDRVVDHGSGNTELFTVQPDGENEYCVTCDSEMPPGFIGQPAWHPDGEHLVLQVENEHSMHSLFEHLMWGINNDLWVIRKDGRGAERIFASPPNHGVLHPHFSPDGTRLLFAERIATGERHPAREGITPGAENPWDGWRLHLADFDISAPIGQKVSNHRILFPHLRGFVETHGFRNNQSIVFSFTPDGLPYVDDIYLGGVGGQLLYRITNSPSTWEEHGVFSPSGRSLAFMSSIIDPSWQFPSSRFDSLKTEIYLLHLKEKSLKRITFVNNSSLPGRRIATDFSWDRTSTRIVFQLWIFNEEGILVGIENWVLTFPEPR